MGARLQETAAATLCESGARVDPSSPELKALLQRCRETPADDMPRLVLADWLDEQGESDRATFVRVQIARSHPSADAVQQAELKALERGLLEAHAEEWTGELRAIVSGLRYGRDDNRGIAAVRARATAIGRMWDMGWERGLIRLTHLDPAWLLDPALRTWMGSPAGDWLEQVNLAGMGPDAFERLVLPPECVGRIGLRIRRRGQEFADFSATGPGRMTRPDEPPPQDWSRFFRCSNFRAVRSLSVEGGAAFLRELGDADLRRLIALEARNAPDTTAAAHILATIPFESLSSLDIGPVTAAAVRAVIASPFLRNLAAWNLVGSPLGDEGMIALCESPLADSLSSVSFPNTGLGDAGIRALVASPMFARLNSPSLNLMMNCIGDDGLETLAASEHLLRYRELVLRENACGDRGAAALAESEYAANFTHLDFWRNRIGDAGASALARSEHLGKIVDLCVKENAVGPSGAAALCERFGERAKV